MILIVQEIPIYKFNKDYKTDNICRDVNCNNLYI